MTKLFTRNVMTIGVWGYKFLILTELWLSLIVDINSAAC